MLAPPFNYRYKSRHEVELGIHTYRRPTRDFVACRGLCVDCKRFFRTWPGWPNYDGWNEVYPGDLILQNHDYFRHTAARRKENPDFHLRKYDPEQLHVWVLRDWRAIPYHECELCALMHSALTPEPDWFKGMEKVQLAMIFRVDAREATGISIQCISGRDRGELVYLMLSPNHADAFDLDADVKPRYEHLMNSNTGSQRSLSKLRRRLDDCCRLGSPDQTDWSPNRLVEVVESQGAHPSVRIRESSTTQGHPPYLTLSHRWGKLAELTLTESNIEEFKKSIPWTSIPKTYQDALSITLEMGYSYIWIDSLCVIQDSVADWMTESLCMSEVYGRTALSLFAGCSNNDQDGIFRSQDHRGLAAPSVRVEWPGMTHSLWFCDISPGSLYRDRHLSTTDSSLSSRGWCLQEELLPLRLAYFGSRDVFWICAHGCASETYPRQEHSADPCYDHADTVRDAVSLKKLMHLTETAALKDQRDLTELFWTIIIQRFSSCKLTYDSDKLIALSGIAQNICSQLQLLPEDYLAGFWKPFLMQRILWNVSDSVADDQPRGYDEFVAPSWSWASVRCEVRVPVIDGGTLTRLVGAEIGSVTGPFGQLSAGHLDVRGPVWAVGAEGTAFFPSDLRFSCGHCVAGSQHMSSFDRPVEINFDTPPRQYLRYFDQHPEYHVLGISLVATGAGEQSFPSVYNLNTFIEFGGFQLCGLLLRRNHERRGEFRRVGTVYIRLDSMMHEPCGGHELPEGFFIEKHADRSVISKTVLEEIEKYSGGERLPSMLRVTSSDEFRQSPQQWEQRGRLKWPKTYLNPPTYSVLHEPVYTVRIV